MPGSFQNGNGKTRLFLVLFMIGLTTVLLGGGIIHLENRLTSIGMEQASRSARLLNLEKDVSKLKTYHEQK